MSKAATRPMQMSMQISQIEIERKCKCVKVNQSKTMNKANKANAEGILMNIQAIIGNELMNVT